MAQLTSQNYRGASKTGEKIEFASKQSVTIDGEFRCTFDKRIEESVQECVANERTFVTTNRKGNPIVAGTVLKECQLAIKNGLNDYLECDVTYELVILYAYKIDIAYCKTTSGEFFANGTDAEEHGGADWHWNGTLHATKRAPHYSVGLVAEVAKKVTYTRASKVTHEYKGPDFENFAVNTYGERLDSFVGFGTGFWGHDDPDYEEMPYTEEAAKFFYDMLIGMCKFADKIDDFFKEPDNVIKAINKGESFLLPDNRRGGHK